MSSRPRDRKQLILNTAADLFAQRGFAAVSINDIGAAVGITGPAIYPHFAGKDALLSAVLAHTVDLVSAQVGATRAAPADAAGLDDLVRGAVAVAIDHPAFLATYLRERPSLDGPPTDAIARGEARVRRAWREAVAAAGAEVPPRLVVLRQQAALGALSGATRRPTSVPRPRLDDLLVTAALAIALAPPGAEPDPVPGLDRGSNRGSGGSSHEAGRARPGSWTPPPSRRDEILTAALGLFRERGFHGVGIDEIGVAAGITGPTVYHYYDSKAEILLDAYDRAGQRVAVDVEDALGTATSADDALRRLARAYTVVALENVDLIVCTSRDADALPEADRPRLARRGRVVADAWVSVLGELRPDLNAAERRLVVRMVFALVNQAATVEPRAPGAAGDTVGLVLALCHTGSAEKS